MGLDPRMLDTSSLALAGMVRPGRVVLDSTLAASYGLHCRSLDEALRSQFQ
jgi:hypothetical protein